MIHRPVVLPKNERDGLHAWQGILASGGKHEHDFIDASRGP